MSTKSQRLCGREVASLVMFLMVLVAARTANAQDSTKDPGTQCSVKNESRTIRPGNIIDVTFDLDAGPGVDACDLSVEAEFGGNRVKPQKSYGLGIIWKGPDRIAPLEFKPPGLPDDVKLIWVAVPPPPAVAMTTPASVVDVFESPERSVQFKITGTYNSIDPARHKVCVLLRSKNSDWQMQQDVEMTRDSWELRQAWIGSSKDPINKGDQIEVAAVILAAETKCAQNEPFKTLTSLKPLRLPYTVPLKVNTLSPK